MKKFFLTLGIAACACTAMACGSMQTSTTTTTRGGLVTGHFEDAQISVKDFEPVKLVFASTTVDSTSGAFMTYDALMKEAAQAGAHAIINVVIEDVKVCERDNSSFNTVCQTTRYGSALAIKYTKPLTNDYLVSNDGKHRPPREASSNAAPSGFAGLFGAKAANTASSTTESVAE